MHSYIHKQPTATGSSKIADPEAMQFVSAADSPLANKNLLIVSGSTSNTITVFEVKKVST